MYLKTYTTTCITNVKRLHSFITKLTLKNDYSQTLNTGYKTIYSLLIFLSIRLKKNIVLILLPNN